VLAGRYFFGTAASCNRIQAVLNATANSILTLMLDEGLSFEDGVRRAQALGIAERDPARDTSGYDTAYKMVILANALMGAELMPADVLIRGIEHVTGEALRKARARGRWIHLMGETWKERENVYAQVEPKEVDDPFFVYMRGTAMGVRLERRSGSVELKVELAPGEELMATAEAIFDDIVAVARERHRSH
jgi:homoserine dehydrogenase